VDRGIYISSDLGPHAQNPFLALITPLVGGKKVIFPIPVKLEETVAFVKDLLIQGKFKPLIDRTYTLAQVAEAFRYVGTGEKIGNVILKVDHADVRSI
jgi:NADPH:quinone reductase-like Zn-dependent oxidoreductase